ncbi:MAG TPA: iron ABC transporter permease [Acidimicrobiia bacterium]|nr:iron ABC transporter permease [Acidimicrobiia bacterium]
MRPAPGRVALIAIPVLFLGYFFVYPVTSILLEASTGTGGLSFLTTRATTSALWFTLWQATVSTALTLVVAFPLTWVLSTFRFPGRRLVLAVVTVPFVLPTVVVASAFIALGLRDSVAAILLAHVFFNVSVIVRTVTTVWARLDRSTIEAARVLGASPWQSFRRVTLPLLAPSIGAATSIVFLLCFTSFGIVLILGGLRHRTIEVEIYQRVTTFLDLPAAGALALVQLVGITAVMAVYARMQERRSRRLRLRPEEQVLRAPRGRERWTVAAIVGTSLLMVLIPPAVLVARSLRGGAAGWRFLADPAPLAIDPGAAIANSLQSAAIAALIALLVGVPAAMTIARAAPSWGRWVDVVVMLPLGTSAVTIGLGFLVALDRPIDLRTAPIIVPIAHALVAIPFVVRAVLPTIRSIQSVLRDAAAVLGASPRRVWREVDLPLMARAVTVAGGFAAAVSLGEFGATAFIVRPGTITVPTLIFRLLGRPGAVTFSGAMAMAVILMVMVAGLVMALDRLRAGELGSF